MASRKQPDKAARKGLAEALTNGKGNGKHVKAVVKPVTLLPAPADPLARLNALREQLLDTAFGVGRQTRERIVNKLLEIAEGTESEGNAINAGFALAEFDRTGIAAAKIVFDGIAAAAGVSSNDKQVPRLGRDEVDEVIAAMLGPGQPEPEDEAVMVIEGFKKEAQ